MISRWFGVGVALLALLTVAPVCLAQDLTTPAAPSVDSTSTPKKAAKPAPKPSLVYVKRASMGGLLGWSSFYADKDYASKRDGQGGYDGKNTRGRPAFQATFRYQVNHWLRWQISPGYTWSGYQKDGPMPFRDPYNPADSTTEHVLTQVLPITAQAQFVHTQGDWIYHVGGGGGVYRVWVENRRDVLADPVTFVRHSGFYGGVCGELGVAKALHSLPSVSLEAALDGHWIFAERDEQFPSGFNSFIFLMEAKVGANYHFDPARFLAKGDKSPGKPAGK